MSGYSPSQHWQDRGQGFGEGPPLSQLSDTNCFSDMGYLEEPMLNGGVPPHGIQGLNRDFQRQPCSPGSGTTKWNSGFFNSSIRLEPPHRGQYSSWVEHGNNSPRFSDHSSGSPRFSDSEHGRLEGHGSPKINISPFSGRRREDLASLGSFHRFYEHQDREPDIDRIPPPFGQPHLSDNFHHYDYHHGELPVHEHEFQGRELHQGDFAEHGELHRDHLSRGFRGRGGLLSPRSLHPSHAEDRMGMSSFQGSRVRPYDPYSSPVLNTSPWSPTCDSPDSPVPNPLMPYMKGKGSPRDSPHSSYSPRLEELSHRRPLPPLSQQMFGRNPRMHEKASAPMKDIGPVLHGRRGRFDPRRREYNPRTENGNNKVLVENAVPHISEAGDFHETRDPRLRKSIQKQQDHIKQQHENVDVLDVVCHDHVYSKMDAAGIDEDEDEDEDINQNMVSDGTAAITSPLPSSFLSVIEKGIRQSTSKLTKKIIAVLETSCTSSESSLEYQSITATSVSQSSSAQPSLTDMASAISEAMSVASKLEAHPNVVTKHLTPSLVVKKSNLPESESLHPPNNLPDSSSSIKAVRTSKNKVVGKQDVLHPLVFSLNDFALDLDTEASSGEEEELFCSPVTSMLRIEEGSKRSPQWAITRNDLGKLLRLAKVDATRISSGINGRFAPVKLATYASKSSPIVARNQNLMKRRRRRRRRKKVDEEKDEEWDEEMIEGTSIHVVKENYEDIDAGDDEEGDDDRDDDYICSITEHCDGEEISSGLLRSRRARRVKSSPGSSTVEAEETENMIGGKETEGRRSRRQKKLLFEELNPEVLTTRSRAETATLKRRKELEKEIEINERERLQTAVEPQDDLESSPSVSHSLDLSLDDSSAVSITSSSMQSSVRDLDDGSTGTNLLAEFSPDVIAKCKRIFTARSSGDTPLHKVCRTGKLQMARYLILVDGASVNAQDHAGWTPLHEACCSNRMQLAELLLKSDADVNVSARDGTRPIHDAIETGNLDLVKLLLQHGADPMAELGERTPLEHALAHEQYEIHDYLETKVREKMRSHLRKSSSASPASVKKKPTRASRKGLLMKEAGESQVAIPVHGYGSDGIVCGEELDFPLFYVAPIIELSDCPFLPVYNFKLSSSENPRRHNFHLVSDILNSLDVTEEMLLSYCNKVHHVEFTVAQVLQQMDSSSNCHKPPLSIMSLPHTKKLKFLPVCQQLRELLDITVENLDD